MTTRNKYAVINRAGLTLIFNVFQSSQRIHHSFGIRIAPYVKTLMCRANWAHIEKIALFLAGAGSTGLLYIGVLFLFSTVWNTSSFISVSIAYALAMTFYFLTNKLVVFKKSYEHGTKHISWQLVVFIIMSVFNYLATLSIVWIFKKFTGEIYSGSIVAGIVTTLIAFFVFKNIFK